MLYSSRGESQNPAPETVQVKRVQLFAATLIHVCQRIYPQSIAISWHLWLDNHITTPRDDETTIEKLLLTIIFHASPAVHQRSETDDY